MLWVGTALSGTKYKQQEEFPGIYGARAPVTRQRFVQPTTSAPFSKRAGHRVLPKAFATPNLEQDSRKARTVKDRVGFLGGWRGIR